MVLAQAKFSYNNLVNKSTWKTPFEIITRIQPRGISYLRDVVCEEKRNVEGEEFVGFMKSLHEETKVEI